MKKADFVAAIVERPDDTELRLVFADWLEETGDDPDRATYIRQQCALVGQPKWTRGWIEHANWRRQHPASEVAPPLPRGVSWPPWAFERGFGAHLQVRDPESFLANANEIFAASPVTKISFDASAADFPLPRILDRTEMRRLRGLEFKLGNFDANAVTRICESSNLERVEKLSFTFRGIAVDGLRALLRGPLVARLSKLNLSNDFYTADTLDVVGAFREAPELPRLRTLKLEHDCLDDVRDVLRPLTGLRELLLGTNRLSRDVAPAIARLDLEALDLSNTGLNIAGLRALTEGLPTLRCLRLQRNGFGPRAAPILARASGWPKLEYLDLDQNRFGPAGVEAILDSPALAHVPRGSVWDHAELGPELRERLMAWSRGR